MIARSIFVTVSYLLLVSVVNAQAPFPPISGPSIVGRDISIDQDELMNRRIPFRKIVESGRHLFSIPFTKEDGYGEGPEGPRMKQVRQLLSDSASHFNLPIPIPEVNAPGVTRLRLNGLDADTCFSCHNTIGQRRLPDTISNAFAKKAGVTGGPAEFASNAFINPALQTPVGCDIRDDFVMRFTSGGATAVCSEPRSGKETTPGKTLKYFMHVRNPPHVFGTGYAQQLAEEMTGDLRLICARAITRLNRNRREVSVPLRSKGISFGTLRVFLKTAATEDVTAESTTAEQVQCQESARVGVDVRAVSGVSRDLVVRPFQWKGIASNERNFVRDALNFHFGMESHEGRECDEMQSDAPCINGIRDVDRDGHVDEMSYGNVSALTIFTMSIRPPAQVWPKDEERRKLAERGKALFMGDDLAKTSDGSPNVAACASCHRGSLHMVSTIARVHDPRKVKSTLAGTGIGLSARSLQQALPIERQLRARLLNFLTEMAPLQNAETDLMLPTATEGGRMLAGKANDPDYYTFDLSMKDIESLPLSFPRLPESSTGGVDVPLFSDLRRHHMGAGLCTVHPQGTDTVDISVPEDQFLTRPLWGVVDTGPWLHDGRATSLRDAILLHAGGECIGHNDDGTQQAIESEANQAVARFTNLSATDQGAIIAFLETLQLPVDPRYTFDDPPK